VFEKKITQNVAQPFFAKIITGTMEKEANKLVVIL
jgi:hypothetical protein